MKSDCKVKCTTIKQKMLLHRQKRKSSPSVQRDRGGFDIGSIMALEAGSGRVGHRPLVATQPNATEEAFLFVALVALVAIVAIVVAFF